MKKIALIFLLFIVTRSSDFLARNLEARTLDEIDTSTPTGSFYKTHGILMVIAWAFFFDLSLMIIRYAQGKNKTPPFQILHSMTMWITIIISTVSVAMMIDKWRSQGTTITAHGVIGMIILANSSLSLIGGIATIQKVKANKVDPDAVTSRKRHATGGYLTYILTRVNLIIGCVKGGDVWMIVVFIWMGLVFLVHILITIKQKKNAFEYFPIDSAKISGKLTQDQQNLVSKINQGASREELLKEFPKIKWVIYGNNIVDCSDWLHPGGTFFIEETVGREVTQFLKGAFTLETDKKGLKPHKHSRRAYEFIQTAIIGTITDAESSLIDQSGKPSQTTFHDKWKLISKEAVSKNLSRFEFASTEFFVKGMVSKLNGFGRHFTIKFKNREPARTYTTALSLTQENLNLREAVYSALNTGNSLNTSALTITKRKTLPLYIKEYNFPKGLSKQLHSVDFSKDSDSEFLIEGPSGSGINLNSLGKGEYYIICAGTGVLPFLDLLNYLFFKTAYDIYKEKGNEKEAEAIKNLGFDFPSGAWQGKLTLIGAFQSREDTYGYEIISKLAHLTKKFQKGNFRAILKSNSGEENIESINGKFDENGLRSFVKTDAGGYLICGPPEFNISVPRALKNLGIEKTKINFV